MDIAEVAARRGEILFLHVAWMLNLKIIIMPTNMLSVHSHKDNNEVAIHEDNNVLSM